MIGVPSTSKGSARAQAVAPSGGGRPSQTMAAPTTTPGGMAMPTSAGAAPPTNLNDLASLFLNRPASTPARMPAIAPITQPVAPDIPMPVNQPKASQAPVAAESAAYQSQKGETPGQDGNMFYQGKQYSPVGGVVNGYQKYATGTGNGTQYLTLKV